MLVAIQPDYYGGRGDSERSDASSPKWSALLAAAGHQVRMVDVYANDIVRQVRGCAGFMWRHGHLPSMRQVAARLLPVLERELGIVVYPNQQTCWHYDDKVAQRFLLEAAALPLPRTWVLWAERPGAALAWPDLTFPVVLKLSSGAGGTNVRLVRSRAEADAWKARLFGDGLCTLDHATGASPDKVFWQRHKNHVLVQEYLPGNDFDTRVTVIGNRAFAYRRFNRPGDFRASGSGLVDHDPAAIPEAAVRLAFAAARRLRCQSVALDLLQRDGQFVISEISYTYVSWMVKDCPGHWYLTNDLPSGMLGWREGHLWPEEAQVADFLVRLEAASVDSTHEEA